MIQGGAFFRLLLFATVTNAVPLQRLEREVRSTLANNSHHSMECISDDVVYHSGDQVPSPGPCEQCFCDPPNVICTMIKCKLNSGCKTIQRANHCCPDYKCDCEYNGRIYNNGERLDRPDDPCQVCYCKGGEVMCTSITCYEREDCKPHFVEGQCCPKYDHCPIESVRFSGNSIRSVNSTTYSSKREMQPWLLTKEVSVQPSQISILETSSKRTEAETEAPIEKKYPQTIKIREILPTTSHMVGIVSKLSSFQKLGSTVTYKKFHYPATTVSHSTDRVLEEIMTTGRNIPETKTSTSNNVMYNPGTVEHSNSAVDLHRISDFTTESIHESNLKVENVDHVNRTTESDEKLTYSEAEKYPKYDKFNRYSHDNYKADSQQAETFEEVANVGEGSLKGRLRIANKHYSTRDKSNSDESHTNEHHSSEDSSESSSGHTSESSSGHSSESNSRHSSAPSSESLSKQSSAHSSESSSADSSAHSSDSSSAHSSESSSGHSSAHSSDSSSAHSSESSSGHSSAHSSDSSSAHSSESSSAHSSDSSSADSSDSSSAHSSDSSSAHSSESSSAHSSESSSSHSSALSSDSSSAHSSDSSSAHSSDSSSAHSAPHSSESSSEKSSAHSSESSSAHSSESSSAHSAPHSSESSSAHSSDSSSAHSSESSSAHSSPHSSESSSAHSSESSSAHSSDSSSVPSSESSSEKSSAHSSESSSEKSSAHSSESSSEKSSAHSSESSSEKSSAHSSESSSEKSSAHSSESTSAHSSDSSSAPSSESSSEKSSTHSSESSSEKSSAHSSESSSEKSSAHSSESSSEKSSAQSSEESSSEKSSAPSSRSNSEQSSAHSSESSSERSSAHSAEESTPAQSSAHSSESNSAQSSTDSSDQSSESSSEQSAEHSSEVTPATPNLGFDLVIDVHNTTGKTRFTLPTAESFSTVYPNRYDLDSDTTESSSSSGSSSTEVLTGGVYEDSSSEMSASSSETESVSEVGVTEQSRHANSQSESDSTETKPTDRKKNQKPSTATHKTSSHESDSSSSSSSEENDIISTKPTIVLSQSKGSNTPESVSDESDNKKQTTLGHSSESSSSSSSSSDSSSSEENDGNDESNIRADELSLPPILQLNEQIQYLKIGGHHEDNDSSNEQMQPLIHVDIFNINSKTMPCNSSSNNDKLNEKNYKSGLKITEDIKSPSGNVKVSHILLTPNDLKVLAEMLMNEQSKTSTSALSDKTSTPVMKNKNKVTQDSLKEEVVTDKPKHFVVTSESNDPHNSNNNDSDSDSSSSDSSSSDSSEDIKTKHGPMQQLMALDESRREDTSVPIGDGEFSMQLNSHEGVTTNVPFNSSQINDSEEFPSDESTEVYLLSNGGVTESSLNVEQTTKHYQVKVDVDVIDLNSTEITNNKKGISSTSKPEKINSRYYETSTNDNEEVSLREMTTVSNKNIIKQEETENVSEIYTSRKINVPDSDYLVEHYPSALEEQHFSILKDFLKNIFQLPNHDC